MKQDLTDWLKGIDKLPNTTDSEEAEAGLLLAPVSAHASVRHAAPETPSDPVRTEPAPVLYVQVQSDTAQPPQAPADLNRNKDEKDEKQETPGRAPLHWPTPPTRRAVRENASRTASEADAPNTPPPEHIASTPTPAPAAEQTPAPAAEQTPAPSPTPSPEEATTPVEADAPEASVSAVDAPEQESAVRTPQDDKQTTAPRPSLRWDTSALPEGVNISNLAAVMEASASPEAATSSDERTAPAAEQEAQSDDRSKPPADRELDRDVRFSQRLHEVIRLRKMRAEERREQDTKPLRRVPRAAIFCLAVLLCAAVVWLALRHVQHNSYDYLSSHAERLYQEERYDEAMAVYEEGHEKFPSSAPFLMGLARSAGKVGRWQTADLAWDMYLRTVSEDDRANRARALYGKAEARAAMNDAEGAVSNLLRSTKYVADNYDVYLLLGEFLERQGRAQDALRAYRIALDLRPASQEADASMKRMLESIRVSTDARQDLRPAYEKRIEVGTVALNLKRYDDAISYFSQALELRSGDARPWLGLAGAWQGKGDNAKALKVLEDARKQCPGHPTIETLRGELRNASSPRGTNTTQNNRS